MRDLNKEYNDMVLKETPDIWSRIEAGLDERQKAAVPEAAAAAAQNIAVQQTAVSPKRKIIPFKRIMAYAGGVAAAVICICLVLPAISGSKDSGTTAALVSNHVRQEAPAEAATAAASETMADEAADMKDHAANKDRAKGAMNFASEIKEFADGGELAMETAEEPAAMAEESEDAGIPETDAPAGGLLFRITMVPGAEFGSINYIIEEFSLSICDEKDDTLFFIIPEGIDTEELKTIAANDENIAESEIITTEDYSNFTR
ncbi:MAG: hypothetical protein K5686_00500 [Lachnospiraceae bacterium]|nr:hypothetical protein [Lachnospiraceae bacterium]